MEQPIQPTVDADNAGVAAPQIEQPDSEVQPEEFEQQSSTENDPAPGENDSAAPEPKPVQDAETNAKFAEMRRKMEQAEQRAKKADEWAKSKYGHLGINTWEEYLAAEERERERQYYEEQGIDPEVVEKIVDKKLTSHPAVIEAERVRREAHTREQLSELNKEFPDLKIEKVEDLFNLPHYEDMHQRILKGYSFVDAYRVSHWSDITRKAQEAARQATLNNTKGKEHLRPNGDVGDVDSFTMPSDVLAEYKRMFAKELRTGKMTEKDFIEHYKKSRGK